MELRVLQYFLAIAREQSIVRVHSCKAFPVARNCRFRRCRFSDK